MVAEEFDAEEAAAVADEIVGDDVLAQLADASRRYGVMITLYISPNVETPGET